MTRPNYTTLQGLHDNCYLDPHSGCWIWMGAISSGGYGQTWNPRTRKPIRVHRLTFILAGGEIPDGLELDHLCRVRSCCNPAHLRAVTHRGNMLAPGSLSFTVREAAATHCPHGHPYAGNNLLLHNGWRYCRECKRMWDREYQRARRAAHKLEAVP